MAAERSAVALVAAAAAGGTADDTGEPGMVAGSKDGADGETKTVAPDSSPAARTRTRTTRMTRTMTRTMKRKRIHQQHGPAVGHGRCRSTPVDR